MDSLSLSGSLCVLLRSRMARLEWQRVAVSVALYLPGGGGKAMDAHPHTTHQHFCCEPHSDNTHINRCVRVSVTLRMLSLHWSISPCCVTACLIVVCGWERERREYRFASVIFPICVSLLRGMVDDSMSLMLLDHCERRHKPTAFSIMHLFVFGLFIHPSIHHMHLLHPFWSSSSVLHPCSSPV